MNRQPFLISSPSPCCLHILSLWLSLQLSACFPVIFSAFLSFFPGISSSPPLSCSLFLSFPPPSSFSHPSAQHYSSMGAVAMQIKCCNPEAEGCSGCMLVCVCHLQRTGCSWLLYNMATAAFYDRCSIPHPLSIIISTAIVIIIAPSFQFFWREGGRGHS